MIELMNVVQAMDPKLIEGVLRDIHEADVKCGKIKKSQLTPVCNIKPLLNFIADKTNGDRIKDGTFWSAGAAARIIGVSKRQYYNMRSAAVTLDLIGVETRVAPTTGERDKPSVLRLSTEIFRYVDENLFERLTGRPWTTDSQTGELAAWVNKLHTPSELAARGECISCTGSVHPMQGGSELAAQGSVLDAAEPEYNQKSESEGGSESNQNRRGPRSTEIPTTPASNKYEPEFMSQHEDEEISHDLP